MADGEPFAPSPFARKGGGIELSNVSPEFPAERFVIPATVWKTPNHLFVSRDYGRKESAPEWGITASPKSIEELAPFQFDRVAEKLINGETLGR